MSVREQFARISAGDVLPEPFALDSAPSSPERVHDAVNSVGCYAALKRALDLAVAVAMLVLLSPLLVTIALCIALDSPGPAIFRQTRLGKGGRAFRILKFRTMNVVEDGAFVVQATRNDARITRIGAFLRKTSLDELPQLLNVVRGDMSLVGPRPHASAHDALYGALIEGYEGRQAVRPGVTGWAQVNGFRGGTPTLDLMRGRVEHDLWYVQNLSLGLDLRILLSTPLELLRNRNAY